MYFVFNFLEFYKSITNANDFNRFEIKKPFLNRMGFSKISYWNPPIAFYLLFHTPLRIHRFSQLNQFKSAYNYLRSQSALHFKWRYIKFIEFINFLDIF